jgi:inward rectifier potassium channel
MEKPTFDPGLTQQYTGALKRTIDPDGRFNIRRTGGTWRDIHLYLFLINASWWLFFGLIAIGFVIVNMAFAGLYMGVGIDQIKGTEAPTTGLRFLNAFFFSAHTITTVGYGNMYPAGPVANSLAAVEATLGLLGFAIATGLLFGRFSRPSARIGYSNNMLVAPYQDGVSLQFRIVNRRSNNLINLQARLVLMTVEPMGGRLQRKFTPLELERSEVLFLALTWTIVHPIDERSPLYGKTAEDLERLQAEVLALVSGFDDTFGQTVHSRYSYRYEDIKWGAKFAPAFEIGPDGELVIELDRVSAIEPAPLGKALHAPGLP